MGNPAWGPVRFPTKLLEISSFICPCVTGDITPHTHTSGLCPYFMLPHLLQLCAFTGPSLGDCLFAGLLDHLVQFMRLISSCKVPLRGFLLCFTRFKVRYDHPFCLCLDLVFISAEQSRADFRASRDNYRVERSINGRHLHSALQLAGELGGRLCTWGKKKK